MMRTHRDLAIWLGALVGTVLFLGVGLVPTLLYGGYLGVMVGTSVTGGPIAMGNLGSYLILIGMAVSLVSVWSLFVVGGAATGAVIDWAGRRSRSGRN